MPNRVTYGAKAVTWDYEFISQFSQDRIICVTLTEQEIVALLTVTSQQMSWRTRWFNADESVPATFAANLQRALLDQTDCADNQVKVTEKVIQYVYQQSESRENEMCVLRVEYIGGKPYLEMDCGCGQREYFALTGALVEPDTGTVQPPVQSIGNVPQVEPDNLSCYQTKATNYLLDRAVDFIDDFYDVVQFGIDVLTPDEWLDGIALVNDIANDGPDVQELKTYPKQDVIAALQDSTFRATMAANWNYTQNVTIDGLYAWVRSGPLFVDLIPVRIALELWLNVSLVFGYGEKLKQIAITCQNGFEPEIIDTPIAGTDFVLRAYSGSWTVTPDTDQVAGAVTVPAGTRGIGVRIASMTGQPSDYGNFQVHGQGANYGRMDINVDVNTVWPGVEAKSPSAITSDLEAITGAVWNSTSVTTSQDEPLKTHWQFGDRKWTIQFDRIYIVSEV